MPLRTFTLNSREFHQVMRELRERQEGPLGVLPRDPVPRERGVIIEPRKHRP
jgi:hypothetical protein